MNPDFKNHLLKITKSSACKEIEVIQSLWSGYGKISRYQLVDSLLKTVVVKHIALNQLSGHSTNRDSDYGHNRKVKSYQVETHWYEKCSQHCTDNCAIPKFIGSFSEGQDQWIILEDLNEKYPLRKRRLNLHEVKACLKWLANFHFTFLNKKPVGLWEVGTYWHLATRPHEFEKIQHQELKSKAHLIDELLNQCKYQTIVHGDAKLANFCFSANGENIAGVDFQYVGGGCGMKDVAYFLGSCLSSSECERYENELLDYYFSVFQKAFEASNFDFDFKELEGEWRALYPVACTDLTRFLMGWLPSYQGIDDYNLKMMDLVLSDL